MSNATISDLGKVNNAGTADALFLKVWAGEVLSSFEQYTVTADKHMVRAIPSGKSAQFPVMGRSSAEYHTPGNEIVGSALNHNEKIITINDLLISHHFLASIQEAKNHYDVRSVYTTEMGRALAFQMDKHVLQVICKAAKTSTANVGDTSYPSGTIITSTNSNTAAADLITAIFDAAEALDDNYVPAEDRFCFLKPEQYYLLANASNAINVDFSGMGSIAAGVVPQLAGINLIKTPHLPTANISGTGVDAGGAVASAVVDARNTVALVMHPSAVGTVKLMDLAVEMEYDIRRQGTLMVAKYAQGHDVLRPEAAVQIRTAAP
ncbi:MAG: hypothetical protein CMQ40_04990 [Gammaproteobacteria bacterium]|nr:hypothetical protein [Gammaproteobacteria bacterium]|tara:strand:- start:10146 stop:11108 length:963 start_codon:yes stop_codon:yes gene_type:complete